LRLSTSPLTVFASIKTRKRRRKQQSYNNNNNNNNNNKNNNNNFIFRRLLKFYIYTYTRKSYLKKAFVNTHYIINHTQTKLIIHV